MRRDDDGSELARCYVREGYAVRPVADAAALRQLRRLVAVSAATYAGLTPPAHGVEGVWLDAAHQWLAAGQLNEVRVQVMARLAEDDRARRWILAMAQPYLDALVGNELAMQQRPNLSIQMPGDTESVLALHADTWSGHSPFELVVWIPLVDCWGTKSLYVVSREAAAELWTRHRARGGRTTEDLFDAIADEVRWVTARVGEVVLFDQSLPHGNRVNGEASTRWSINCRFTGLFTPYADKGLGDFFVPVSVRPVTALALNSEGVVWG